MWFWVIKNKLLSLLETESELERALEMKLSAKQYTGKSYLKKQEKKKEKEEKEE